MGYKYVLNPFTGTLQKVLDEAIINMKDPVASYSNLPITGNSENDARFVQDTDILYVWSIAEASGQLTDWKEAAKLSISDLDEVPDGTTYGRIKNTELENSKVKKLGFSQEKLDLEYIDWLNSSLTIWAVQPKAQLFIAGKSGVLSKVILPIRKDMGIDPPDLVVEIRNVIDDKPGASILASETIAKESIPNQSSPDITEVEVIFSTPCSVTKDVKYAIVSRCDGDVSNYYHWFFKTDVPHPYTFGVGSADSGASWPTVFDIYFCFETYVTVDNEISASQIKTDSTKLSGIESGATADQSDGEIQTVAKADIDIADAISKKHEKNKDTKLSQEVDFSDTDGFETWSGGYPDGWFSIGAGTVTKDGVEQHGGSWCAKLTGTSAGYLPFMQKDMVVDLTPYEGQPLVFSFFGKALSGSYAVEIWANRIGDGGIFLTYSQISNSEWVEHAWSGVVPAGVEKLLITVYSEHIGEVVGYVDDMEVTVEGVSILVDLINNGELKRDLSVTAGKKIGTKTIEDYQDAVSKKHSNASDHTQGTDQKLDDGGAYEILAAEIEKSAIENISYYVDCDNGSDENPGTEAEPFETIRHALDMIPKLLTDKRAYIYLEDSLNYHSEDTIIIKGFTGGNLAIFGKSWNPDVVLITSDSNYIFSISQCTSYIRIGCVSLKATVENQRCIDAINNSQLHVWKCDFGEDNLNWSGGIQITYCSRVHVNDCHNIDGIDKVSSGLEVRSGAICSYYESDFGDKFLNDTVVGGGLVFGGLEDGHIFLKKSEYDDAVSKKHSQAQSGVVDPTTVTPDYIGQIYVNTNPDSGHSGFFMAYGIAEGNWSELS